MDGNKNLKLIFIVIIIAILINASIMYFVFFYPKSGEGITAFEGKEIADEIAYNWNENAILIHVRALTIYNDGTSESWVYYYSPTNNIVSSTYCLSVRVFNNLSTTMSYDGEPGDNKPIQNWAIDSDEAYEIAMANFEVNLFMMKNPKIDSFSLGNASGNVIWHIMWDDNGFLDNPSSIRIEIDANTGDILNVDS